MPRPKGVPNKNKRGLLARLKQQYGEEFDPIMRMAEQAIAIHNRANETDDLADRKLSVDSWEKVTQYVEPKLKAMEVDVTTGGERLPARIELVAKSAKKDG